VSRGRVPLQSGVAAVPAAAGIGRRASNRVSGTLLNIAPADGTGDAGIVYEAVKKEFLSDVFEDRLVDAIVANYNAKIGRISKSEVRAWDQSMQYMHRVLADSEIPDDAGVAIEFKIPYTSRRVDFIISGRDEAHDNVVIVELKQWETVEAVYGKEAIVRTVFRHGMAETIHPSYQAWSYAALIKDFNENVQSGGIRLFPCAYLHNYSKRENGDPLTDPIYRYYIHEAPVFVRGQSADLRNFIKRYIKYGDNKENLYKIEHGKLRPSKSLQDCLNRMLQGNEEFRMIDDQKVVYEEALAVAQRAARTGKKHVLIVKGGPGTGKSVLAVNLLVKLTNLGLVCQYVTKNAAPRHVYAAKLKRDFRKGAIDNLFRSSGSYVDAPRNEFDALIVDEAHRLNEKSGMFQNRGENQIKEIIHAAKASIFFIDEFQQVTLKDAGSVSEILRFAEAEGAVTEVMALESQFRCNGSDGYLAWIDDVLQLRETANTEFDLDYDFRVFDDPNELRDEIIERNKKNNKSRIVAGYCWDWTQESKNNPDIYDITIDEFGFKMSWNLGNTDTWAIDEDSVHQAGCIHTCQGLEFDYVGVIIGEDLYCEDGLVKTDYKKRAKTDQSLKGLNVLLKQDRERALQLADRIIRNTYRTLLTRGQKGCFVFCVDKNLGAYLKSRVQRKPETEFRYGPPSKTDSLPLAAEQRGEYRMDS